MRALKFLAEGARGRFSGHAWPLPEGAQPGAWVTALAPLTPCLRGIHACRPQDLAYWLDAELWEVELDGAVMQTETMIVAARGRLIARVAHWDAALQASFGQHCLGRAHGFADAAAASGRAEAALARDLAQQAARLLARGKLSTAAYVSAFAAQCALSVSRAAAFAGERAAQSAWLAERIG